MTPNPTRTSRFPSQIRPLLAEPCLPAELFGCSARCWLCTCRDSAVPHVSMASSMSFIIIDLCRKTNRMRQPIQSWCGNHCYMDLDCLPHATWRQKTWEFTPLGWSMATKQKSCWTDRRVAVARGPVATWFIAWMSHQGTRHRKNRETSSRHMSWRLISHTRASCAV